jgi:hypothetical protein
VGTFRSDAGQRAAAIRDHLIPLVLLRGQKHQYGQAAGVGPVRLTTWDTGRFRFVLRVPYSPSGTQVVLCAEHPRSVPPQKRRSAPLPFGLDIWMRRRLLSIAWEADGAVEVIAFRRGTWEGGGAEPAVGLCGTPVRLRRGFFLRKKGAGAARPRGISCARLPHAKRRRRPLGERRRV